MTTFPVLINQSEVRDEMHRFTISREAILSLQNNLPIPTDFPVPELWYTTSIQKWNRNTILHHNEEYYIELKRYIMKDRKITGWIMCPMRTTINCQVFHYGEYQIPGKVVLKLIYDIYQNGFTVHDGVTDVF